MDPFEEGDLFACRRWEMSAWCCRGVRGAWPPNFDGEGVRKVDVLLFDLMGVENIAIACSRVTGTRDQKQLKCDENDEKILWPARGLYAKETNTETTKREIVKGGEENVCGGGMCGYLFTPR